MKRRLTNVRRRVYDVNKMSAPERERVLDWLTRTGFDQEKTVERVEVMGKKEGAHAYVYCRGEKEPAMCMAFDFPYSEEPEITQTEGVLGLRLSLELDTNEMVSQLREIAKNFERLADDVEEM